MVLHTRSAPATNQAGDPGHRMNEVLMIMGRSRAAGRVPTEQKSEHSLQRLQKQKVISRSLQIISMSETLRNTLRQGEMSTK
eukprot:13882492-Heterocapsa_arctica.AAC.1